MTIERTTFLVPPTVALRSGGGLDLLTPMGEVKRETLAEGAYNLVPGYLAEGVTFDLNLYVGSDGTASVLKSGKTRDSMHVEVRKGSVEHKIGDTIYKIPSDTSAYPVVVEAETHNRMVMTALISYVPGRSPEKTMMKLF